MAQPKKICQLCAVDFTMMTLLLPLVDAMKGRGWTVTCVCSNGRYVEAMRRDGYQIHTVPISRRIFSVAAHFRALILLVRFFRREKFDVLHVHTPIAALLGRIAGKIAKVPTIVYTAHGFHFHDEMPRWKYRLLVLMEKIGGKMTDILFTQSTEDRRSAVDWGIVEADRVSAIGNGVNLSLFEPISPESKRAIRGTLSIPDDAIVIGIVCRMVREKGLIELFEAAIRIADRFPNVYFLLVGERISSERDASMDGDWRRVKDILGPRLIVTGHRSDVADMLGAMDVFCLPSYREGMPRSIIEAMMMALPIVATNIRGSREEVVDEETGFLVPTRNSDALGNALGRLIADSDLRYRMGQLGRQRAIALYDERHALEKQLEIISARMLQ